MKLDNETTEQMVAFQKEFDRLAALDAEGRKYFASQGGAPCDPQKVESPSLFLCE